MQFSSSFVCATHEYNTFEHHIPNPQFRKSFAVDSLPDSAELTICGLGYYELFLNGQNITKGYMAPYRANPDHYLYYDRYDITEYLTQGENVIGILLGNGFLNSNAGIWDFDKAPFRSSPKVALCLALDDTPLFDATSLLWHESPITFDEFHAGEYYNANLETDGWTLPGFDDSAWKAPLPAQTPKGEPRIPTCEPIGVVDIHHPARIIKSKNGYIYDFAVNCAGLCELNIQGKQGQEVIIRYGEILRNGELDQTNITYYPDYPQEDRYILKGASHEQYMPHFTYHGFRFAEVTGITAEQATPELLTFYEMSSSLSRIGDFHCDNADINALFDATMRSDRANFMYFPTDCPQREKNGWTGDAALSAEQFLIYFDCADSLKEWLRNIYRTQNEEGAIPGIVPTDTWGFAWGNGPSWDDVMFELPYRIYQYTGDTEILQEASPHLWRYLQYMEQKRDEKGLLHYGLGDWCHVRFHQAKVMNQAMLPNIETIVCKNICDKAAFLFTLLGEEDRATYARTLSAELTAAYQTNAKKITNQSVLAMELYYDILPSDKIPSRLTALKQEIHGNSDHMDVGAIGSRALFRVLGEHHMTDLALQMILNPTAPSFQDMLNKGLTALPEDFKWFAHRIDEFDDDPTIDSLNHHFWGDIAAFFMRHLAGIQAESSHRVRIAPDFTDKIHNLNAHITLPAGRVAVTYKVCDIMVEMTVSLPAGVEGTVEIPAGYRLAYGKKKCHAGENLLLFCRI